MQSLVPATNSVLAMPSALLDLAVALIQMLDPIVKTPAILPPVFPTPNASSRMPFQCAGVCLDSNSCLWREPALTLMSASHQALLVAREPSVRTPLDRSTVNVQLEQLVIQLENASGPSPNVVDLTPNVMLEKPASLAKESVSVDEVTIAIRRMASARMSTNA